MEENKMKYYYKVYGLNIESEIKIQELVILNDENKANIDVTIYIDKMPESINTAKNQEILEGFRKNEMWFYIKGIATYYIRKGQEIVVEPYRDIEDHYIKTYILGSAFGLLLIQKNIVAIHGGAVVFNDKAIICTGDTGAGKSTLTSALRLNGAKLVADDVSAIDIKDEIMVYPAYPQQKLCGDAVRKLGYDTGNFIRIDEGRDKYAIPSKSEFIDKPVKLSSIFEIMVGNVEEVEIKELRGSEKMNTIMKNIYRGYVNQLAGLDREYFKKCLKVTKDINVYRIIRPKDEFTVDEQIQLIKEELFKWDIECISL